VARHLGLGRAGIHTLSHALQHPSARILRQHLGFNTYGDLSARSIQWRFFTVLRALPGGRILRGTKGSGHAREPTLTRASPVITTVSRTEQMVSRKTRRFSGNILLTVTFACTVSPARTGALNTRLCCI